MCSLLHFCERAIREERETEGRTERKRTDREGQDRGRETKTRGRTRREGTEEVRFRGLRGPTSKDSYVKFTSCDLFCFWIHVCFFLAAELGQVWINMLSCPGPGVGPPCWLVLPVGCHRKVNN